MKDPVVAKCVSQLNPKDRLGARKVPLSLVPPAATAYTALAMQNGAKKYGPYNWREKKVKASVYVDAALRHILAWFDGEERDADSGVPHLGHGLACLSILVDAQETGNLVDDRPTPGPTARILEKWRQR